MSASDDPGFALDLYGRLRAQSGNLCFSPFSLRVALAMACAGARGETAREIGEVLGAPPGEPPHEALAPIVARIQAEAEFRFELALANSVWCRHGARLEPAFGEIVAKGLGGEVGALDFARDPEAARRTINRWISEQTRGTIPQLVGTGMLAPDTGLVLANAVYFKSKWQQEFRRALTSDAPFHLEGGASVDAPLMHQSDVFPYVQRDGYQAVELPYQGETLALLVLLPENRDGLRQLEEKLSPKLLRECVAKLERRDVDVFVPRFEIRSRGLDLVHALAVLGVTRAFTREADFSGIDGRKPPDEEALSLTTVVHEARVDVSEKGTEASAASAVFMRVAAAPLRRAPPPPPVFRADHPFVFAIRERESGAILFLGRVADPTRSG